MNKKSATILIFFSIIIIFLIVFVNKTFINLLSHKTITSPTKQEEKWIVNGPIYAVLPTTNNITYLGGDFSYIGPYTGSGVILNTVNNQLLNSFPKINGVINTVISDGKNGWYIGGNFSKVGEGELARHNIAHILPNGVVDINWNVGVKEPFSSEYINWSPDKEVYALALNHNGSILYVGGAFTKIGTKPRNGLAALDAKTGLPLEWNPEGDNRPVYTLSLSHNDKILYVGGEFDIIGGKKRNSLAAIDTRTALATDWDPNPNLISNGINGPFVDKPIIYKLYLTHDDKILYVGGEFNNIGGKQRNHLAAIETTTGLATNWDPKGGPAHTGFGMGIVRAMVLNKDESILYVGGNLVEMGGQRRIGLAAVDTSTGLATNWTANVRTINGIATLKDNDNLGRVYSLTLSSDESVLYVGGEFDIIGYQPPPCPDYEEIYDLGICYYFDISTMRGEIRKNFAAVDVKTGKVLPLNFNTSDAVYALSLSPDDSLLYIGGSFDSVGGEVRHHLAAFNSLTGQLTSWNPDAHGDLISLSLGAKVDYVILSLALSPDGSILYVGGNFDRVGGQERHNLAAIDTKTGLATNWNPQQVEGTVRALSSSPDGSILYVGGNFNSIGGQERNYLAAIDTKTGLVTDWNPDVQMAPSVLAEVEEIMPYYWFGVFTFSFSPDGSILYVGGNFDSVGGQERHNLAAIDTKTGLVTDWNPNSDSRPQPFSHVESLSFSPDGSILYVGGNFHSIGGQERNYLAAIDTKTGLVTDWDPDICKICKNRGDSCDDDPKFFLNSDGSVLYVVTNYYDIFDEKDIPIITAIDTKSGQFLSNLPTNENLSIFLMKFFTNVVYF